MTEASIGIAGLDSIRIYNQARLGVAGVNTFPLAERAHLGISSQMSSWTREHVVGKLTKDAHVGIAGNFSTTLRRGVEGILRQETERHTRPEGDYRVVDQMRTWQRCLYMLCFDYLICTDRVLGYRWREGFEDVFSPQKRIMPLALDNSAYRRWVYDKRKAQGKPSDYPGWATHEEAFWAACELTQPDLIFGWDVVGDIQASVEGYKRFRSVYGDKVIPVWQAPEVWDPAKDLRIPGAHSLKPEERAVIANANAARHDPVLRWMCGQSKIVAIGGMVHGPLPPGVRHQYIAELCRCFPDNHFWALGMARDTVVNGLGQLELLDRVWLDGSWWIHDARNDRLPYVDDGLIRCVDLGAKSADARKKRGIKGMTAFSFFTLSELMVAHLRCLHAGYLGRIQFPRPLPLPIDTRDLDQMKEIKQLMLWDVLPPTGTEG